MASRAFVLYSYRLFLETLLTGIALTEKKMKLCGMVRVMKDGEGSCLLARLLACFP